ncbi:p53 and DNA damage-regulated protein 1 [Bicyclus anynana]|uniref:p53 and DNA damage-regulated protein 1 n=1 Tax=Bicyclus anynana TaxID=110368 RepID=A0A6J1MVB3_BICAN|nr:p53 and DNA damage-regulated protein 1 [Bicyclus anynana]
MDNQTKVLKYLISIEKLAEEIITDKREIVLLDKRRNQNREALRDINKACQTKCWVTVGSVLVKHNLSDTVALLEADQKQLNIDINKLRSNLKIKVNDLRDLEMQPPVPGSMLVPLSDKESEGLSNVGLFST